MRFQSYVASWVEQDDERDPHTDDVAAQSRMGANRSRRIVEFSRPRDGTRWSRRQTPLQADSSGCGMGVGATSVCSRNPQLCIRRDRRDEERRCALSDYLLCRNAGVGCLWLNALEGEHVHGRQCRAGEQGVFPEDNPPILNGRFNNA